MDDEHTSLGAVARGCGSRVAGGAYIEVPLSKNGKPVEFFLVDPPLVLPAETREHLGITAVGVHALPPDANGVVHLVDWVGEKHYPNVQDFIEEVRRLGLSRRISTGFDFSLIGPDSKILLMHRKAGIQNAADWRKASSATSGPVPATCPKDLPAHLSHRLTGGAHNPQACAGMFLHDVGDAMLDTMGNRVRHMPWGSYQVPPRVEVEPQYEAAVFMALPVVRLAYVNDPDEAADKRQRKLDNMGRAAVPTVEEDL